MSADNLNQQSGAAPGPQQPVQSVPPVPPPPLQPPPPLPPFRPVQPVTPPPAKGQGCGLWVIGIIAAVFFLCTIILLVIVLGLFGGMEGSGTRVDRGLIEQTVEGTGRDKVLVLPLFGVIGALPAPLGGDSDTVAVTQAMLKAAASDESVKAVVLYIDSPGGGITASDVLYHDFKKFREETKRPVVALLGDVAASGGYYVASSADLIVAHPTTVTGSIGVIMPLFSIEGLLNKIGVQPRTIKSGEMKDLGSMMEPMTPAARKVLQDMVDAYYSRFVDIVLEGMHHRGVKIERPELLPYVDGRVFTGDQAMKLHFVDKIGYFDDAVNSARVMAGLPANSRVVTYHQKPGLLQLLLAQSQTPKSNTVTVKIQGMPSLESRFMYMWLPGETQVLRSDAQ